MNKRQQNKRSKRKWQKFFSEQILKFLHKDIKPSRIKTKIMTGKDIVVLGIAGGYELKITLTAQEVADDKL